MKNNNSKKLKKTTLTGLSDEILEDKDPTAAELTSTKRISKKDLEN